MNLVCPLGKECVRIEGDKAKDSRCHWWVILRNENGEDVGKCAMAWLPVLLIELKGALKRKEKPPLTANVE